MGMLKQFLLMTLLCACAINEGCCNRSPSLDRDNDYCPSASLPIGDTLHDPLRIGAWNTQRFGKTKIMKPVVIDIFLKIMRRFDILVLQEVTDSTLEATNELLAKLNAAELQYGPRDAIQTQGVDGTYNVVVSPRLGRSKYKEQYAIFYRVKRVILNATYLYPDPGDIFQAEPFVTIFDTPTAEVKRVALIPLHASPDDAVKEIDGLVDVYNAVVETYKIKDILILGDFNAGCSYVTGNKWDTIRLHKDPKFLWVISEHTDTTTKETTCPYDRIVVAGSELRNAIYENSAAPFYYDSELNINDEKVVEDVSDHYPVEVLIQSSLNSSLQTRVNAEVGVSVETDATSRSISKLKQECVEVVKNQRQNTTVKQRYEDFHSESGRKYRVSKEAISGNSSIKENPKRNMEEVTMATLSEDLRCGTNPKLLQSGDAILVLEFLSQDVNDALKIMSILGSHHPCVFTPQGLAVIKYKLDHGVLHDASLYGSKTPRSRVKIKVICINDKCTIYVTKQTLIL